MTDTTSALHWYEYHLKEVIQNRGVITLCERLMTGQHYLLSLLCKTGSVVTFHKVLAFAYLSISCYVISLDQPQVIMVTVAAPDVLPGFWKPLNWTETGISMKALTMGWRGSSLFVLVKLWFTHVRAPHTTPWRRNCVLLYFHHVFLYHHHYYCQHPNKDQLYFIDFKIQFQRRPSSA